MKIASQAHSFALNSYFLTWSIYD